MLYYTNLTISLTLTILYKAVSVLQILIWIISIVSHSSMITNVNMDTLDSIRIVILLGYVINYYVIICIYILVVRNYSNNYNHAYIYFLLIYC